MALADIVMIIVAGILATYVHMVFALWAPCFGLPRLDFPRALSALSFSDSFDGDPPYGLGLAALHLNGIGFAFLYATLIGPLLPGPPLIQGLIYGFILLIASQCVFVPFFLKEGFFGSKGPPRAWMTALVVHGIYGAILGGLCPIV